MGFRFRKIQGRGRRVVSAGRCGGGFRTASSGLLGINNQQSQFGTVVRWLQNLTQPPCQVHKHNRADQSFIRLIGIRRTFVQSECVR